MDFSVISAIISYYYYTVVYVNRTAGINVNSAAAGSEPSIRVHINSAAVEGNLRVKISDKLAIVVNSKIAAGVDIRKAPGKTPAPPPVLM